MRNETADSRSRVRNKRPAQRAEDSRSRSRRQRQSPAHQPVSPSPFSATSPRFAERSSALVPAFKLVSPAGALSI